MTTRVPIRYGGTGANSASAARTALGVPPLAAYDTANSAYDQANTAYGQANDAYTAANNRVLKSGDTMTGALNIACTTVSTSNTTGALIVGGGVGITGNTFSTGKLTIGNSIQHPNIGSIVNQSATTGTTAYRPVNLVDTSATIKIARVGTGDPAIEFQKWDADISLMNTRYDLAAGAAGSNTLAFREITGSTKWRFLVDANGYVAIGGGTTAPVQTSNLHVFGNANITLGINTATVNATTVNAQTFVTSTGANVYSTALTAYAQANAAYAEANLKLNLTGGTIGGDLAVSGNLTVSGNTYYVNVSTYQVDDPLIYLAANNDTSDVVDIGFMGGHNTSGVYQHSGLIRHAADGNWYLFTGLSEEGHENNVVDIANTTLATLKANINANSLLLVGNSVATQANLTLVYNQANDAYTAANNRVLKAGDTMTGNLIISGATINVSTANISTIVADALTLSTGAESNGNVVISANGSELVRFTNTGRVGIGTTTPTAKLDIVDSVNDTEVLRVRTSGGNSGSVKGIAHLGLHYFSTGNNSPVRISVEELDNADYRGHLLFSTRSTEDDTAPTERMRIDANGNVGIGITSPSKKLHVVGSTIISDGATPANNATLLVQDDGVANTVTSSATFRIANDGSGGSFAVFEASSGVSNTVITNAGNMGIGTTTPAYKLDVVGVVRATGNVFVGTGAGTQAGDDNLIRPTSTNAFLNIKGGAGRAKFVLGNDGVVISSGTTDQIAFYTNAAATTTGTERMRIDLNGNVSIGTISTTYKLEVNGSFAATTKSFVINHPTKPGMKLRYGSLEGPENGVYVRGKLTGNVIELPDYWTGLVDSESITVNLTPIGKYQKLFIEKIEDNKVYVASENWFGQINCYYTVFAERKDVEKLVVEY